MNGTEILRLVTSAFGAHNPMRLVVGLSLGALAKMLVHVLTSSYPDVAAWKALNEFGAHWFLLVCVPIPFWNLIFAYRTPEGVAQQIQTIRALLDEQGASKAERTQVWRSITAKYLAAVTPDLSRGPSLEGLFKEVQREAKQDAGTPS